MTILVEEVNLSGSDQNVHVSRDFSGSSLNCTWTGTMDTQKPF